MHTWHKFTSLHDEIITHLTDESNHLGRSVVVTRVLPNEQHGVKHWLEQLKQSCEIIHGVHLLKILAQWLQVSDSVIGL